MFWIIMIRTALLLLALTITSVRASSMKTLTWKHDGGSYSLYVNPDKSYQMAFAGEQLSGPCCNHLSFKGRDQFEYYEACVQIVEFDVECGHGVLLQFSASSGYDPSNPDMTFDCDNIKDNIHKFCAPPKKLLHVAIISPEISNSRIVFNVTSGLKLLPPESKASFIAKIFGGTVAGVFVLVVTVYCVCSWRREKLRKQLEREEENEFRRMNDNTVASAPPPEYKDIDMYPKVN